MYKMTITGLDKFKKLMGGARQRLPIEMKRAMREAGFAVERHSKRAISMGSTRALITGNLRRSIGVSSVSSSLVQIRPSAHYALFVHEGTRFMRPRPFMKVGAEMAKSEMERIFGRRIKTALNIQ